MKITIALASIFLLVVCPQIIEARDPYTYQRLIEKNLCEKYALANTKRDIRGIRDVWYKIKASAIQSWYYIKGVAEQTKAKIQSWIDNAKQYVYQIEAAFEEKLEDLKNIINNIVSNVYGTGELFKECFRKEKEQMEIFLKTIMQNMGECIAEEIKKIPYINATRKLEFNEAKFTSELDGKVELCERDPENIQECIFKAREEIFDQFAAMQQDILKTHFETKSLIDDIQTSVATCSVGNIADATNFITNEAIEIINCVMETKNENNNEIESTSYIN